MNRVFFTDRLGGFSRTKSGCIYKNIKLIDLGYGKGPKDFNIRQKGGLQFYFNLKMDFMPLFYYFSRVIKTLKTGRSS
jgi:hypothetical protein